LGAALSADGRWVAFESDASTLVPGDANAATDVFVHDRLTGETARVSVGPDGQEANGPSRRPALSVDGRWIFFQSRATNLDPARPVPPGVSQIYLHDLEVYGRDGLTRLAANGPTIEPAALPWTADEEGTYFVRVAPAPGSAVGCGAAYRVAITRMEDE
jgi:hypothetical protein